MEVEDQWSVTGGVITEDVWLRVVEPTRLDLLYVFMYPWTAEMTDYLWADDSGAVQGEAFVADRKFRIQKPARWLAVYNRATQSGAVLRYLVLPEGLDYITRIWDQPTAYKKHYLQTFGNTTLPRGSRYHFRIAVQPFAAGPEQWQAKAGERATALAGN